MSPLPLGYRALVDAYADFIDEAVDGGGESEDGAFALNDLDWDPEGEAAFLDGALTSLYLFNALEELERRRGDTALEISSTGVPLPVLAASMVMPEMPAHCCCPPRM